jgi:acyl-CoA thioesterase YciA
MELLTRHLCKASDLGVHGNLFGGKMLSWLDEAGAIMATRICKTKKMVTVKMDGIEFHTPVKENHDVTIYGEVVGIGTSSITLKLMAKRYDVYNGKELEVCSVTVVFVRISGEGTARPIDLEIRNSYTHLQNKKNEESKS